MMNYEKIKQSLQQYNWDDGFSFPKRVIDDENCDLALALEVFYLADGFGYFQTIIDNNEKTSEWFKFVDNLFNDIKNGKYNKTEHHYEIPLTRVQKYKLEKSNISSVFLTDL